MASVAATFRRSEISPIWFGGRSRRPVGFRRTPVASTETSMNHRLLFLLAACGLSANSQTWSTFLDPSRAIDWTRGVGFTLPSYTVLCPIQPSLTANAVSAAAANTTAIQNALASCDSTRNVVNIPAGTYYVNGWSYGPQGQQVVRGAGPMATTVIPLTTVGCGGLWLGICMIPNNPQGHSSGSQVPPSGTQQCRWTAGYAKGATTITLSDCGSPPAPNQLLILLQANDTADTGGVYICDSHTTGCALETGAYDGPTRAGVTYSQEQVVWMNGVSENADGTYRVSISPGIYFNNIRAAQTPYARWPNTVQNEGLENLTVQHTAFYFYVPNGAGFEPGRYIQGATSGTTAEIQSVWGPDARGNYILYCVLEENGPIRAGETIRQTLTRGGASTGVQTTARSGQAGVNTAVAMFNCYQCWVKNVRSLEAGRNHVWLFQALQPVVRDSYFYEAQTHGSMSYAIELSMTSGALIENNIFQQVTNSLMFEQGAGSVVAYNYEVDNLFGGPYMQSAHSSHNAGNSMNLWEGNNFRSIWADNGWGSSSDITYFRNLLSGWQSGKTVTTNPILNWSFTRAYNAIGNVMGQPGYHDTYESYATSSAGGVNGSKTNRSIYTLGWSQEGRCHASPLAACDPLVRSTLMRWGNYDTVNDAVRWDSTEASPGAVPYVSANFDSHHFTALAHTLPASLYYTSKPSWWPATKPWPPIGPDVSAGNVGICSGKYAGAQATSSSQCMGGALTGAWASHATSIPAHDCYLDIMNGPPDGTGNVLSFDANLCYGSSRIKPAHPTKRGSTVQ